MAYLIVGVICYALGIATAHTAIRKAICRGIISFVTWVDNTISRIEVKEGKKPGERE